MSWVGRPLPRSEDLALLRGLGLFTADAARGARRLVIVRSPVARGRVIAVKPPPGATVITASDLEGVRPIRALLHRPDYIPVDQPILAADRVTHVGEPVAAVMAPSLEEAEDIADAVELEIEAEEAIIGIGAALEEGAATVHDNVPGNVLLEGRIETPGFDDGMATARQIIEIEIRSGRQSAMPMEARGGSARIDRASGRVTLTCSVQMPHMLRTGLADVLGMREADLRVVAPDVGGGFGQKMALIPEYVLVVWAARHFGVDVAWIEDRRENMIAGFHSRDQVYRLRGGFDADARIVALEGDLCCDIGAYSCYPVTCGVEVLMAMGELPGPYDLSNYKVRSRGVTTNTCPMAPFRGVSRPVMTFAIERLMDTAAARLGISPVEIRRRNLVKEFPYRTASGVVFDAGSYVESLDAAERLIDLDAFRKRQREAHRQGRLLGVGFAVFNERSGFGTPVFAARNMGITLGFETVEMAMDPSGHVEARIGASPHGQGLKTALSQVIADELGVAPEAVRVISGDTDRTPYGWGTFASRSMVIAGGACKLAAQGLQVKMARAAARLLQADADEIILADGEARVRGGGAAVAIAEVARAVYHSSHLFKDDFENALTATATYDPAGTFSNACHAAIVEVDRDTGAVTIERFLSVEDAGRLINPMIAEGQLHGGIAQGIANALYEEVVYDRDGNILTATLADYLVPTATEIPMIEVHHLETVTDASITGAKGLGEGGAIGAPAAVINAVCDALSPLGIASYEMPTTPQRIRALIRAAEASVP
jgi:carbon-monoxide dehydrogenase large subunit